jgi:hypothetical protein
MTNAYTPPGVTVAETSSTSVSALIASATDICIVGLAGNPETSQTPITTTDTVILSGTNAVVLPTLQQINNDAELVSIISVVDVLNPQVGTPPGTGYAATTDYTFATGESVPDGNNGTISRVVNGNMPDGTLIAVTYTYLPSDYWNPIRLTDIGSVESRFGVSWATATSPSTGQTYYTGINSQLSMAARIAFNNGAPSVICQPLFTRATPGDPATAQQAPSASQVGDSTTWSDTLYVLRPISDLEVIVPICGQDGVNTTDGDVLNIFSAVQAYQAYMNSEQQYIVAIMGEDGTSSSSEMSSLLATIPNNHAPYLQSAYGNALSSQGVLINNTVFQLPTPSGAAMTINVGGQYCAAAIAGMLASRNVASSLTRQSISGFQSITDPRVPSDKNNDAGAGLMVVEQVSNSLVRIRQGNTLDIADGPARQELSVVRAKFVMMESIQQTLDNQVIGSIIADANSPLVVRSAIASVLGLLQTAGAIVGYSNVAASLTSLDPTTITASFNYQPSFPLNYVNVTFAIDLTANTVTFSDSTSSSS